MLIDLHIKNFILVEQLDLEFHSGMTVITGETGAGKSIIIDALELAMGARANTDVIHPKSQRCEITVSFDISGYDHAKKWLVEQCIESDEECILRRIISRDGRSRSFINGQHVPSQLTRQFSHLIVDIHGQHEHQLLLKADYQRQLLDNFSQHNKSCDDVQSFFNTWKKYHTMLDEYTYQTTQTEHQDLLNYQIKEIEQLKLTDKKVESLEKEYAQQRQAEDILNRCRQMLDVIAENEYTSLLKQLYDIVSLIEPIQQLHPQLDTTAQLINQAIIQCQEAKHEVGHYLELVDLNPERLHEIESQLDTIYKLARKHHLKPAELPHHLIQLKTELSALQENAKKIKEIQNHIGLTEKTYNKKALQLSSSRQVAAQHLSTQVTAKIQQIGLSEAQFYIHVFPKPEQKPTYYGYDTITFHITPNPGQSAQPLSKIASGGELSRLSLALQVTTAQQRAAMPTFIFDEVDVGIGGKAASCVGALLHQLGKHTQVICITHLPQVAALGHHHICVDKTITKTSTQVKINTLTHHDRIQEIARMLGGTHISKQTIVHAETLLSASFLPSKQTFNIEK